MSELMRITIFIIPLAFMITLVIIFILEAIPVLINKRSDKRKVKEQRKQVAEDKAAAFIHKPLNNESPVLQDSVVGGDMHSGNVIHNHYHLNEGELKKRMEGLK